jgi:tight adherence protein B
VFLVPVTFLLILSIILGSYWLLVVRPETEAGAKLRRRIRGSAQKARTTADGDLLKPIERLSSIDALESVFKQSSVLVAPLQKMILQSGLQTNVAVIILSSGCLALLCYWIAFYFTRFAPLALAFGILGALLPVLYVRWMRSKRLQQFEETFPEAIDLLARALRAGHALTTGLAMVSEEMPPPVSSEFRQLYDEQNFGLPLPEALKHFAERVPLIDARFFVTAVLTQRDAGGNLSEVLDNLAAIIRDRFRVKRQVRVISAHGRISGLVLACLPPSLAVMFVILTPEAYKTFYSDPIGVKMIGFALLLQLMGVVLIRRIVNIEY